MLTTKKVRKALPEEAITTLKEAKLLTYFVRNTVKSKSLSLEDLKKSSTRKLLWGAFIIPNDQYTSRYYEMLDSLDSQQD